MSVSPFGAGLECFLPLPSLSPCTFPHVNYISCHGNRDVIGTGGLNDIQKHSLQRGLKCIPWLAALGYVAGGGRGGGAGYVAIISRAPSGHAGGKCQARCWAGRWLLVDFSRVPDRGGGGRFTLGA